MLTHCIKFHNKVVNPPVNLLTHEKPKTRVGSELHKKSILKGTLKWSDWEIGDTVVVKNMVGDYGHVIDVLDLEQFDKVEWDGLKPKFIEVFMVEIMESVMCHPADLLLKDQ